MFLPRSRSNSRFFSFSWSEESRSLVDRARVGDVGAAGERVDPLDKAGACDFAAYAPVPEEAAVGVAAAERETSHGGGEMRTPGEAGF